MSLVRTRFAPSPTGFIHLGNIRSALYPWAFARHSQGQFVLRIEDTDTERSNQNSVDAILQGMQWLGLDFDEGPIYQSQRYPRYREVVAQLLEQGLAYPCYTSSAELDALREQQMARHEKPRYDGRWRPEAGKTLPAVPVGVSPAIRFKSPQTGTVAWEDKVKGRVEFQNSELDDLVICRADGHPTYNFCVVVDDMDMRITHVIRGDDHVNNTPRQIHIFEALGYPPPVFAHLPTVLNEQGEKMSKRHGALSVMAYREQGFLAEAVMNYLARLGWSHGNDEIISREQLVAWFDLRHLGSSAAQFDLDKLKWLNAHYLRQLSPPQLADSLRQWHASLPLASQQQWILGNTPDLTKVVELLKDRVHTLQELAEQAQMFYAPPVATQAELQAHAIDSLQPAIADLHQRLQALRGDWHKAALHDAFKACLQAHGLKMPQLAMPVRLLLTGRTHTPSIDAVLELLGPEHVLARLKA